MASTSLSTTETLAQRLVPRRGLLENTWVYNTLLVFAGSWFVALLAQVSIPLAPFSPVPITGQTLGVLLVGSLLGSRLGLLALAVYMLQGIIGLPFFAEGNSGLQVITGATGGYIIGFIVAAGLVGWLAERGWDRRVHTTVASMVLGTLMIYLFGLPWLAVVLGSAERAITLGLLPFIPGAIIKIAVAAGVLPGGWKLLGSDKQRD